MFRSAKPKFSEGEKVCLRFKTAAYDHRVFGRFSKGHKFNVVSYFVDITATEYRDFSDPGNMEQSFQLPTPEFVYELRDKNNRALKVYEFELKRGKKGHKKLKRTKSMAPRPAAKILKFPSKI